MFDYESDNVPWKDSRDSIKTLQVDDGIFDGGIVDDDIGDDGIVDDGIVDDGIVDDDSVDNNTDDVCIENVGVVDNCSVFVDNEFEK